ncbi:hypothetical protein RvY_13819 [Ramazzottius varieornatus]|uniref:Tc1-like transposase DDE domain-containing protein n=1 Tax=Ramazzottius varieornatus TaxID=947166 RepID=A0A1D1VP73_RAMVA|nr:hypothetical protein RvY_13819 [Ramazzottius varieornatus]
MKKLTVKQPKLVNRDKPLLLHDNAKAHSAKKTSAKLRELGLETLPHPPYSPDLAPTDYHFFLNFDNFLRGRKFNSEEAVKSAFENFAGSLSLEFFRKGLSCLPEKWQKCVDSNAERMQIRRRIEEAHKIRNCIGYVDGTLVGLEEKPAGSGED